MQPMLHRVQYYETDMMGVTHHANYIRWMEEARIDLMDQLGFPYRAMEEKGIVSPVKTVFCDYKRPSTFGDEIAITVRITSFDGVVMKLAYEMCGQDGELVCAARSEHVFLTREGRFVRLRRELPAFCAAVEAAIAEGGPEETACGEQVPSAREEG